MHEIKQHKSTPVHKSVVQSKSANFTPNKSYLRCSKYEVLQLKQSQPSEQPEQVLLFDLISIEESLL